MKTLFYIFIFIFFLLKNEQKQAKTAFADCSKEKGVAKVVCQCESFKAMLNAEQVAQLQLEYSKNNAIKWSNFPEFKPTRVGIRLGLLDEKQLLAAKELMKLVLSQESEHEGFKEMEGNLAGDDFFGEKTSNTKLFNAGNFFIAFLGKPSTSSLWELQFGGHHYALANTYQNGKIVGATPSFRGVEPSVFEYKGKKISAL